jgi:hypothetical protein
MSKRNETIIGGGGLPAVAVGPAVQSPAQVAAAVEHVDPAGLVDIVTVNGRSIQVRHDAEALTITDDAGEQAAADIKARIRTIEKDAEAMRDGAVRRFNELVKRINAIFKPADADRAAALVAVNDKVRAYRADVERKRQEQARAEQARIDAEQRERDAARRATEQAFGTVIPTSTAPPPVAYVPPPKPNVTTSASGARIHTRKVWKWRVTNPADVPRAMCSPDPALIDAEMRRQIGMAAAPTVPVPGVEWYQYESII